MTVDAPKKIWTGERLDGLEQKVDKGFAQIDARFEKVDEQFEKVDARFGKVEGKIESEVGGLRVELMALHRLLLRASIGGGVAVGVLLLGRLTGHI